jgi:hypothetical protein
MTGPWIHHTRVKTASLEWENIPDPASTYRITLQILLPRKQQETKKKEMIALLYSSPRS